MKGCVLRGKVVFASSETLLSEEKPADKISELRKKSDKKRSRKTQA
jgi:hypothetical protein